MSGIPVGQVAVYDPQGRSLRYYAEFSVPELGYTQRYPGAGPSICLQRSISYG